MATVNSETTVVIRCIKHGTILIDSENAESDRVGNIAIWVVPCQDCMKEAEEAGRYNASIELNGGE